ncbi:MAG: tetratricopeptide repeat protein [Candidatus Zixiibacteriota bacterium]|nr:MAG: tetratricopeptide repeat protein [candidate division Zixibacteria bacterium]
MSSESISADSLLQEADSIFQTKDYQAATEKYRQAVQRAKSEFNRSVEVEALSQMARMSLLLNKKDEGWGYLEEAGARASESDPMGWSRYLGVKGRYEWKDGDLNSARKTFDDLYTYCHTNALWGRAIDAANMLAIVSESTEEQIEWSRRGIEAAEAAEEERWLGPLWNNLAATYYDLKQLDSALECYLKARDYHWRYSDEQGKLFADYHVGMTYRSMGDLVNAGKWLRPVLAWAERLDNHSAIGQTCEDLGEIAIVKGRKTEGINFFKRARDEYKKAGFDETWPEVWENINERLQQLGQ